MITARDTCFACMISAHGSIRYGRQPISCVHGRHRSSKIAEMLEVGVRGMLQGRPSTLEHSTRQRVSKRCCEISHH
ncbi:hypothetical protein KJ359_006482 [Pestalotiopsis sp. 9143b]|nr:hypothetical protein KJ359_006482 [Pestalotiopsis sp. 9143b]